MNVIPIQVTEEGVLIPKTYLPGAGELEIIDGPEYVLVRPKAPPVQPALLPSKSRRFSFVGIAHTRNPRASVEAEEILEREVDRRTGWSHE